ncbi:low molecular weight protein-tyrosine-phosphatase [Cohnella thailandensis]|uniref:protein-tyrosine-phosphatase n=1 Tax=Cohnella thailandensis TaxID=557557 RepID=A0A841T687_9BACL|nr:low molecular weight protein-tyrosine-phosphatase [Cohnella thailandensis]MBB6638366.1 low molecular weight phosphotyrosine protein phosphatase [Cohnella thailandensis]MBP1977156.1 protein-tyrosine phosphatase [Cohnella thailandensis]
MSYSVLFVCLGNICRSPMAEAVFRDKASKAGLREVEIDSAGTGDWHVGKPPHEGTRAILDTNLISYDGMRARKLKAEDGEKFDLIVAMDTNNERDIRSIIGSNTRAEVIRFLSLVPEKGIDDVPDPYYTGNFEEVYEMVGEGCDRLIARIASRQNG